MRVLHLYQFEVLLPIRPLLFEGGRTEADLNPAGRAVRAKPGFLHISQVLAAGDGTFTQSSVFNCLEQGSLVARPDTCAHQVPHAIPILCATRRERAETSTSFGARFSRLPRLGCLHPGLDHERVRPDLLPRLGRAALRRRSAPPESLRLVPGRMLEP